MYKWCSVGSSSVVPRRGLAVWTRRPVAAGSRTVGSAATAPGSVSSRWSSRAEAPNTDARPSRKSTVIKNLSFVPFDVFLTASKLSVMTYACSTLSKTPPASPEKKVGDGTTGKSALNQPDTIPASSSSPGPPTLVPLSGLTAEDLLNSNNVPQEPRGSLLSLDSLPAPSRYSARQALGVTIVRQPGRRGAGDRVLEPLLYLQVVQPSALLSCHHRKQRLDVSVFDVSLRGVSSDYKCLDPGKSLPEVLDYSVLWVQTVSGESDSQTGVPPPLACLQIRDFLSGPAELNVELSRPLKVNPTLVKLEQTKAYLRRVLPHHYWEAPKPPSTPHSSPSRTSSSSPPRPDPSHLSSLRALAPFHKVSLRTAQIVVVMETESHPARPSLSWSVAAMKSTMDMKTGPKLDDPVQSVSVLLELQDIVLRTGLKDRSRLLLGPFSCSAALEARWCRHSSSPEPETGTPKLLLDLKGGLLQ
ncbi:intermembrane lipid transfer protein VPS13B-like, partial [Oncorhynchus masou masou]|uniref:intermembrane lipid transfer protein VPS13B-like n=1 Tax=Oncorhynchus masou masou TaxID=90313 RepID=UPI0031832C51